MFRNWTWLRERYRSRRLAGREEVETEGGLLLTIRSILCPRDGVPAPEEISATVVGTDGEGTCEAMYNYYTDYLYRLLLERGTRFIIRGLDEKHAVYLIGSADTRDQTRQFVDTIAQCPHGPIVEYVAREFPGYHGRRFAEKADELRADGQKMLMVTRGPVYFPRETLVQFADFFFDQLFGPVEQ